jgi:hypothetical protein
MNGRLTADQRGMTIVEVLVAAAVLLTGVLGAVTMIDRANSANATGTARQQGVNLAREVLEAGRSIPYAQLLPSAVVAKLQAKPGLANANAGPGWTIQRRGVTYTVAAGVCAVDDPTDGYGTEDPNIFCAAGAKATPSPACAQLMGRSGSVTGDSAAVSQSGSTLTGQQAIGLCGLDPDLDGRVDNLTQADASQCAGGVCQNTPTGNDSTPDDYKRLVTLVTWSSQQASGYVLQSTLIANPGQASGPSISAFGLGGSPPMTSPITGPTTGPTAVTSIPFTVTADSQATSVQWSLDGVAQGSALSSSGSWTFSWCVGPTSCSEVLDGNYTVGVVAFDSNGNAGPPRSMTITLNRRQPYAPTNFAGGHDGSFIDLQWSPNKEGDILGYRVYRIAGSGQPDVLVCSPANARSVSCQDTNPPNASSIQYYVVALDKDPSGNTRPGDPSATLTVGTSSTAPNAPTGLQASTQNGNTLLLWGAPIPAPDFYRIYRDGQALSNRYDTTSGNVTTYTDTATGGVAHTYYVTAVNSQLAESPAVGPVTR